jgi:ribosomal subunit interface protein
MNIAVKFKNLDHSEALVEYVTERFSKLGKFEIKPLKIHVTFSQERYKFKAQVYVNGLNRPYRAVGIAEDSFYAALENCYRKLSRQLEKEKSKIKHHHHVRDAA